MPDAPPFKLLTQEEFDRLSTDQRMEYLRLAMADLRAKLDETRQRAMKWRVVQKEDC